MKRTKQKTIEMNKNEKTRKIKGNKTKKRQKKQQEKSSTRKTHAFMYEKELKTFGRGRGKSIYGANMLFFLCLFARNLLFPFSLDRANGIQIDALRI